MALAIRSAAHLKPEIRLAKAISEFEALLDTEHKKQLQYYRTQKPPSPSDALRLTAQLNLKANNGRHCFGPRFQRVLEFIQHFSAIPDTIIGGSQQAIASAAWGVIKLALKIASGYALYFEKLSSLFMEVGRSCPRVEEYSSLFKEDPFVQAAVCEYYVTFMGLCKNIIIFSKKTSFVLLAASITRPFESEFGKLRIELECKGQNVQDEVMLAAHRAAIDESKEASPFRSAEARFRSSLTREHRKAKTLKEREDLLSRFSTYRYNSVAYKQAREYGSVRWFLRDREYQNWKCSGGSSVMLCTGKIGSGKTVLCASIVDDLTLAINTGTVAYFFCSPEYKCSLNARIVLGTLARQILEFQDTLPQVSGDSAFSCDEIVSLLARVESSESRFFTILIDGMDECSNLEIDRLSASLESLIRLSNCKWRIFCSSRNDLKDKLARSLRPDCYLVIPEVNDEIEEYIEIQLAKSIENRELLLADPTIVLTIRDTLLHEAQGMYLWVKLQIKTLCMMESDKEIILALDNLPHGLPETYRYIAKRICQSVAQPEQVALIYRIVGAAKRPLTLKELREIFATTPGERAWNPSKLPNDIRRIVSSAGCLLFVREEFETIHFAHPSVRHFLSSRSVGDDASVFSYDVNRADIELGAICLTYLSLDYFSTSLTTSHKDLNSELTSIPTHVIQESLPSYVPSRAALSLLKRKVPSNTVEVQKTLECLTVETKKFDQPFAFLEYALQFWTLHTQNLYEGAQMSVWGIFCDVCDDKIKLSSRFSVQMSLLNLPYSSNTQRNFNMLGPSHVAGLRWLSETTPYPLRIHSSNHLRRIEQGSLACEKLPLDRKNLIIQAIDVNKPFFDTVISDWVAKGETKLRELLLPLIFTNNVDMVCDYLPLVYNLESSSKKPFDSGKWFCAWLELGLPGWTNTGRSLKLKSNSPSSAKVLKLPISRSFKQIIYENTDRGVMTTHVEPRLNNCFFLWESCIEDFNRGRATGIPQSLSQSDGKAGSLLNISLILQRWSIVEQLIKSANCEIADTITCLHHSKWMYFVLFFIFKYAPEGTSKRVLRYLIQGGYIDKNISEIASSSGPGFAQLRYRLRGHEERNIYTSGHRAGSAV